MISICLQDSFHGNSHETFLSQMISKKPLSLCWYGLPVNIYVLINSCIISVFIHNKIYQYLITQSVNWATAEPNFFSNIMLGDSVFQTHSKHPYKTNRIDRVCFNVIVVYMFIVITFLYPSTQHIQYWYILAASV